MWALRRTTNQIRIRSEHINALRASATLLGSYKCNEVPSGEESNHEDSAQAHAYCIGRSISCAIYPEIARGFASQVTGNVEKEKKNKDGDEDEGFSELDVNPEEALASDNDITEDLFLTSQGEVSEGEAQVDSNLSEAEVEGDGTPTNLLEDIMRCSYKDVPATIDKWVGDGNDLNREEVLNISQQLQRRKMYGRALKVSSWMQKNKSFMFKESDHAVRWGLIFKLYGISRAEKYFETIPSEMRGYNVYQTRLLNFSEVTNVKKAEEVFNKMKAAGFSPSTFDYNTLLRLYWRADKSKFSNILKKMKGENVKPDVFTYNHLIRAKGVLIRAKGGVGDIAGMEQILEIMKAEGIQTNHATLAALATNYVRAGYLEKAEALMKELEDNASAKGEGYGLQILLSLYAYVGKASDVERVWNAIESFPKISNSYYIAGIRAWGKLGEIEKAEIMFEKMLNSGMKMASPIAYSALLQVYVDHRLFPKAKEFVKRISDNRIRSHPNTCDAICKFYLKSGDVEKADAFLYKTCKQKKIKPFYITFIAILEKYAEKGDIANAEKIFDSLTDNGYHGRFQSYEYLLQAYLKAQIPAYGFKERMLAVKLHPNRKINTILQQLNAFKKDLSSDLLD